MNILSPIQPWVKQIMVDRENDLISAMYKTPYAVLSSGALVLKTGLIDSKTTPKIEDRIKKIEEFIVKPPPDVYQGCIISNNINNIELSYSPDKTPVGIDFTGKTIFVEGETGRKVSTPIITSIELDTEESNNALKTTHISLKCFTLKQLEMFEMFFLKPGMNVMVEWGDSSLLYRTDESKYNDSKTPTFLKDGTERPFKTYTRPEEALFIKKNDTFEKYCDNFSSVFLPSLTSSLDIQENIRKSLGSYDYTAGKMCGYTYSISADGTYDINMEILQSNQLSLTLPKNLPNPAAKQQGNPAQSNGQVISQYQQIKECIVSDLNIDADRFKKILETGAPLNKNKVQTWENDFFNFLKTNEQQKDTLSNSDAYVTLRFILEVLMNYTVLDQPTFHFEIPKYKNLKTNQEEKIIPVHSSKFMLSSSPDIIFPLKDLPTITTGSKSPSAGSQNDIIITSGSKIDGTINGYSYHIENDYETLPAQGGKNVKINSNDIIGNALNIFVKYNTLVRVWNSTITRIDFLKEILDIVNKNSYGLYKLTSIPQFQNGPNTVVCYKFSVQDFNEVASTSDNTSYRFKPTTINSIIRNFSYNFEMDNAIASRMIFNSNAGIRKAYESKAGNKNSNPPTIPFPAESYTSIDFSSFSNADGYYSINNVDRRITEKSIELSSTANKSIIPGTVLGTQTTKENKPNLTETIKSNSEFFKLTDKGDPVRLIYKNQPLIHNEIASISGANGPMKSILTNIQVSITIDGFSGFRTGECFYIDGIPEIYNRQGVFQITNIKQSISSDDGWTTTLEAMWRVGM